MKKVVTPTLNRKIQQSCLMVYWTTVIRPYFMRCAPAVGETQLSSQKHRLSVKSGQARTRPRRDQINHTGGTMGFDGCFILPQCLGGFEGNGKETYWFCRIFNFESVLPYSLKSLFDGWGAEKDCFLETLFSDSFNIIGTDHDTTQLQRCYHAT